MAAPETAPTERVDLQIEGMTCASCAARIEKRLNRLEGVEATVNYATERAVVRHGPEVAVEDLVAQVEATGYRASTPAAPGAPSGGATADHEGGGHDHSSHADLSDHEAAALRNRVLLSAALSLPVIVLGMVPSLQFDAWQWLSLTLAAPVVVWGAWPFHRAAWLNLRHGTATMDTLISLGTLAAFGWSLYALFLGTAGEIGMEHGFSLTADRGSGDGQIYLEVAAGVTTFILAGRYAEVRAKRRSGAALQALL